LKETPEYLGPWAQGVKESAVETPQEAAPNLCKEFASMYGPGQLAHLCYVLPADMFALPERALVQPDFPAVFAKMAAGGLVSPKMLALVRGRSPHDEDTAGLNRREMDVRLWVRIMLSLAYSVRPRRGEEWAGEGLRACRRSSSWRRACAPFRRCGPTRT